MNPINLTNSTFGATGTPSASYALAGRRGVLSGAVAGAPTTGSERVDRVELSEQARALASGPTPIREDLVRRIRAEIEGGTYDIDSRLDKAVNELAKDLAGPIDPLENVYA